jgi:hypothetical protein
MSKGTLSNAQVRQRSATAWNAVCDAWESAHAEFQDNPLRVGAMQLALNEAGKSHPGASPKELFEIAERLLMAAFPGAL